MSVVLVQRCTDGRVPVVGTLLLGSASHEVQGLAQQIEDLLLDLSEAGYLVDIELLGHPMFLETFDRIIGLYIQNYILEARGNKK